MSNSKWFVGYYSRKMESIGQSCGDMSQVYVEMAEDGFGDMTLKEADKAFEQQERDYAKMAESDIYGQM